VKHPTLFLLAAAVGMTLPAARGQDVPHQTPSQHITAFGFGPAGTALSSKQHAPFSAVMVGQTQQTLNDGTNLARENQEVVMRDGMGRIYRGREIKRPGASEGARLMQVTITDPVRHLQYFCTPIRKVCTKMEYRLPPNLRQSHGPDLEKLKAGRMKDVTVDDLGASNISGIDVEGKRITRVIPEGMVGNDRPITTTEEVWRSKELDVDVQVKRSDPRMGMRTTTITEINLGEPDPKYFQIPEGYRLEERKRPTGALAPLPLEGETSFPPVIPSPNQ